MDIDIAHVKVFLTYEALRELFGTQPFDDRILFSTQDLAEEFGSRIICFDRESLILEPSLLTAYFLDAQGLLLLSRSRPPEDFSQNHRQAQDRPIPDSYFFQLREHLLVTASPRPLTVHTTVPAVIPQGTLARTRVIADLRGTTTRNPDSPPTTDSNPGTPRVR